MKNCDTREPRSASALGLAMGFLPLHVELETILLMSKSHMAKGERGGLRPIKMNKCVQIVQAKLGHFTATNWKTFRIHQRDACIATQSGWDDVHEALSPP